MRKLLLAILIFVSTSGFASHFRGMDMWTNQITTNTITLDVLMYTDLFAGAADSPEIRVDWGDGNIDTIVRDFYIDDPWLEVRESHYGGTHMYLSNGNFTISVEIANWESGILNINSSDLQPFKGQVNVVISPFLGLNNFNGWVNSQFYLYDSTGNFSFDLSYIESDADSVSIVQQVVSQMSIPSMYQYPTAYGCTEYFVGNIYHCDNITTHGQYAVSFLTKEYRGGLFVASHLREFIFSYLPFVGIEENSKIEQLKFYPNPVSDILNLNFTGAIKDAELQIINSVGKIIFTDSNIQSDQLKIDLSSQAKGIYFISFQSGNERNCSKLILE
jgi:Secretion system C-terminal sorting domain